MLIRNLCKLESWHIHKNIRKIEKAGGVHKEKKKSGKEQTHSSTAQLGAEFLYLGFGCIRQKVATGSSVSPTHQVQAVPFLRRLQEQVAGSFLLLENRCKQHV